MLRRNADATRRVRMFAAARLRREKTAARLLGSCLSLVIVACSIALLVFGARLTPFQTAVLNVIVIIVSIYIIILGYEFDRREFDRTLGGLERSTARLREFYTSIALIDAGASDEVERAHNDYSAILRESPFPTEERDYQFFLRKFPNFPSGARRGMRVPGWIIWLRHQGSTLLCLKWASPPVVLIVAGIYLAIAFPDL